MISYRGRDGKRGRNSKMTRNIERLYKEGKCRDCSVVVTRMDFAKILGKFTKVKIQYDTSASPKTQKSPQLNKQKPQVANNRLKNNENGMVQFHRSAYNPHPAKNLLNNNTRKSINKVTSPTTRQSSTNILKENNVLKNITVANKIFNCKNVHSNGKQYAIVFNAPTSKHNNIINELTLMDLLPKVKADILPSEDWCIDYFPKKDEPKNDKVYDRIAAELEDLMYKEKPEVKLSKSESTENKVDDFPSIMDILNDNTTVASNTETKDNLESNDVEAMLLGKPNINKTETTMEVDSDVNKLIAEDDIQFTSNTVMVAKDNQNTTMLDNPHSPSILDEALQKGIEEHLPNPHYHGNRVCDKDIKVNQNSDEIAPKNETQNNLNISSPMKDVTHVIFKKVSDGKCKKSVMCPRNLKYSIELEEKSVEFLGAPEYISSIEDLQVLLQIVNETDLESLYVLH